MTGLDSPTAFGCDGGDRWQNSWGVRCAVTGLGSPTAFGAGGGC